MNENATKAPRLTRPVPVRLARRLSPAMRAMMTRALPDDKPKLDVAGFQSSI